MDEPFLPIHVRHSLWTSVTPFCQSSALFVSPHSRQEAIQRLLDSVVREVESSRSKFSAVLRALRPSKTFIRAFRVVWFCSASSGHARIGYARWWNCVDVLWSASKPPWVTAYHTAIGTYPDVGISCAQRSRSTVWRVAPMVSLETRSNGDDRSKSRVEEG